MICNQMQVCQTESINIPMVLSALHLFMAWIIPISRIEERVITILTDHHGQQRKLLSLTGQGFRRMYPGTKMEKL